MIPAKFVKGDIVTWGSGAPLARVEHADFDVYDVVLIRDLKTPCDRVFPAGFKIQMSDDELRPVN